MKISFIIKTLAIIWFTETLITAVLYPLGYLVNINHASMWSVILLKTMHGFYYYWLLLLIYLSREKEFDVRFLCLTNSIVFISISIVISLIIEDTYILFLDYSFLCTLSGIILAPYLLKEINSKLPDHLRIYSTPDMED